MRCLAGLLIALLAGIGSSALADEPVEAPKPNFFEAPVVAEKPIVDHLDSAQLDRLLATKLDQDFSTSIINDQQFLRRVSLDLIGRQPTPAELATFLNDTTADKRRHLIEKRLASHAFGSHWANYWSDTISYRVPPPQLTFLTYRPLKGWLAQQLNDNVPWDRVVRELITGTGKVQDHPEATFVAYHQGNPVKLASETARIFLGLQVQCAECHDHPFDDWKREQFHHLAAFFARTTVKMPWNKGADTIVNSKEKGEYEMPDAADPLKKGLAMLPVFLTGRSVNSQQSDLERRRELANFVTAPGNPWFARAYTNRMWARLMGRGFFDPVDDMGEHRPQLLPEVHERLTRRFQYTRYDVKDLFRIIANSQAYQQGLAGSEEIAQKPFAAARTEKLRGDQVFESLVTAIGIPNVRPVAKKATDEIRFPPPPKSTRELIVEVFGYDPSLSSKEVVRTINQAMLLMNSKQLAAQINGKPGSRTVLSKLLEAEQQDRQALKKLFQLVLARQPTAREFEISLDHLKSVGGRVAAFEDLLWSLINSSEFTTKR